MTFTPTAAPLANEPADGPLTAEHHREMALARDRSRVIRKAASVAAFNGWATAIIAVMSAPFALFDVTSLVMTVALSIVAFNELRGRRRLLAFDPSAATLLGWNQLGLLATIVGYCLWSLYTSLYGASSVSAELRGYADLQAALGSLDEVDTMVRQITLLFYGVVIVLSVAFQGLNAIYYFSRRKHVEAYVAETPQWIRELQRGATTS